VVEMMQLPVVNGVEIEQAELKARIDLANRPRLGMRLDRLNEVAGALSANQADRSRFVADPAAFLNEQAIPVSSCNLVDAEVASRQEFPETFIDCKFVILLNCVVLSNITQVFVVATSGVETPQQASAAADPVEVL
jgi:hypothetical protein